MNKPKKFPWITAISIVVLAGNSFAGKLLAQAQQNSPQGNSYQDTPSHYPSNSSNMDVRNLREHVWNKTEAKDFQGALNDVEKLIEIDPNSAENYMYRGGIKQELGDIQGYVNDLHKAIEINPKDVGIRGNIAVFYFQRNEWENAAKEYSGIINVDPNNAGAYLMRGNCQSQMGNKQVALKDYAQVVKLEPSKPFGYLLQGRTFAEMGQMDKAKEELERAAQVNYAENNYKAFVHRYVGDVYVRFKQPEDAMRHWATALELYRKSNNAKKVEYLQKEIQDLENRR